MTEPHWNEALKDIKELPPPQEDPGKGLAGGGSSKLKVPEGVESSDTRGAEGEEPVVTGAQ